MQVKHHSIGEVPYLAEHLKGSQEPAGTETKSSDPKTNQALFACCFLTSALSEGPPGCSQVSCAPSLRSLEFWEFILFLFSFVFECSISVFCGDINGFPRVNYFFL